MDKDALIKAIDEKIKLLTEQEKPEELLKRALIKKNIINENESISKEKIDEIFNLIKENMK